jgi:hypothetical protein
MTRKIERFDKYMIYKGLNDNKVTINLALSIGTLGKSRKEGRDLSSRVVEKILNFYTDLNPSWLIAGDGNMLIEGNDCKSSADKLLTGKIIPFYDADVAAGTQYGMDMTAICNAETMIEIGGFLKDSECALRVYGNSMVPNYPAGCIIGLRRLYDSFIEPGAPYVIETASNRYLKRLYNGHDNKTYRCVSDNNMIHDAGPMKGELYYQDFFIPISEIKSIYRVVGVIKRNIL